MSALSLKSLIVPSKSVTAEYPGLPGFTVDLAYLSRETLVNLRKKATKVTLKNRQTVEEVNDELFLQLYVQAAIKGWKGLTLGYASTLVPIEFDETQLDKELEYSEENALDLMKNSTEFDSWVSQQINDLGNFQKSKASK